ncbi:MAG TPA: glyceraldehyde 3-phosphate dehydrogenase NAD-binding domain-containing protein [Ginsengibacter sp.]|nr:type I glyceraldehyde-3-phosphate dehydrogenase [Chitinophagaceae bacterium]HRP45782.1 glyceraldehyde 3-phosphate dehydrogenase NAD-binding domain-containing protein [Ginsengibacter sp.]
MRIAINGMGRIGRLLFRRIWESGTHEIVAVNDIMAPDNLAYLLKYDSVYGTFSSDVKLQDNNLLIDGKKVNACSQADPSTLPWKEHNVDVVLECSGKFLNRASAGKHLEAGARKVLLSTTGKEDVMLKVYGFNQNGSLADVDILSPGGCMTNCSTHIIYLLNSFGIESAMINILHSFTSRQSLVDTAHNQYRRGRAASESIIPVDIDLCVALGRLLPHLADRISASSVRVPVPNGAYANFFVQLKSPVSIEEVKQLFKTSAETEYKGILQYTEEPLVSLDIKGNTHSCIIDGTEINVVGKMVRVSAWFDNEYGFTSRMIDWLGYWEGK